MLVLEKLWQGRINPIERSILENSEYQKISHQTTELQTLIYNNLSAEGKSAFDEYNDKEQYLSNMAEQDAFIKGFQLGAQIILDALNKHPTELPQI